MTNPARKGNTPALKATKTSFVAEAAARNIFFTTSTMLVVVENKYPLTVFKRV